MSKPVKPRKSNTRGAEKPKPVLEPKRNGSEESSVKATFYLSQDAVDNLEDAWHNLRRTASGTDRGAITKSLIVRLALEIALEELRQKGTASQLLRRVSQR